MPTTIDKLESSARHYLDHAFEPTLGNLQGSVREFPGREFRIEIDVTNQDRMIRAVRYRVDVSPYSNVDATSGGHGCVLVVPATGHAVGRDGKTLHPGAEVRFMVYTPPDPGPTADRRGVTALSWPAATSVLPAGERQRLALHARLLGDGPADRKGEVRVGIGGEIWVSEIHLPKREVPIYSLPNSLLFSQESGPHPRGYGGPFNFWPTRVAFEATK